MKQNILFYRMFSSLSKILSIVRTVIAETNPRKEREDRDNNDRPQEKV
jgi:hypothetical protein